MRSDAADAYPVAIAGGGFSGTMLAAQLSRRGIASLLADGSGRMARGVAYSTRLPEHLLNVPAGKMSAWADAPDDFAQWLAEQGGGDPATFAQRRDFGRYLGEQLERARSVTRESSNLVAAERSDDGWNLTMDDGRHVSARQLVLAQGNQPPAPFAMGRDLPPHLFVNNPWGAEAVDAVARVASGDQAVLILGTGLTMIDTALSLAAAGFRGPMLALSRRGLAPRAHGPNTPRAVALKDVPLGDVRALTQWLRDQASNGDWRAAIDQLRPHSQTIWRSWDMAQKRRFLRHARPFWDVHRHRIAPQVAARIEALRDSGQLEVVAGRLVRLMPVGNGLIGEIAGRRGGPVRSLQFAAVFNCTGPLGDLARTRDPLLRQLLDDGAVKLDALGIGLALEDGGRVGRSLWALGPLTKGEFWEIVAVPDIRGQCAAVAEAIGKELEPA